MSSVQIKFLGGAREVGRNAITVKARNTQLLLDYGVMLNHTPGFPMHIPPKEIEAIVLTHSHLDHSGGIPAFYIQGKKPLYTNKLAAELNHLLISDFIHLSSYYLPFEYLELKSMMKSSKHLDFGVEKEIGDIRLMLVNAGHIPGSAQILIEAEGKRLLYTGDFNTQDTRLLKGAKMDFDDLDALIIESTYAQEDHTKRVELEKRFVADVTDIVERGGTVLVPAFGVGRSQEIACILAAHHFQYPVAIDGMIREANNIMMRHGEFLRDVQLFNHALHTADWIEGWRDRRRTARKAGVIISTAGMLKGGPSIFYISKVGKKVHNAVFLVSYQIPGTPGRQLLDSGVCVIDGKMKKIKAQVGHYDFSSHCGSNQLKDSVKGLKGKPKIFVIHGAEDNCKLFSEWIRKELGLEAKAPKTGESFKI